MGPVIPSTRPLAVRKTLTVVASSYTHLDVYQRQLLFSSKNIERIGDHTTNIAETVVYLVTGDSLPMDRPKGNPGALAGAQS